MDVDNSKKERVTVHKLDHAGSQVLDYRGEVLQRTDDTIVLRTTWDRPPLDLGYVVLETGGRWTEYFSARQWYNIFEICASDSRLLGWYCNITHPPHIAASEIAARDLALDMWVTPDGETLVLDEDEFAELPLTPEEREAAQKALAELQTMVLQKRPPFNKEADDV